MKCVKYSQGHHHAVRGWGLCLAAAGDSGIELGDLGIEPGVAAVGEAWWETLLTQSRRSASAPKSCTYRSMPSSAGRPPMTGTRERSQESTPSRHKRPPLEPSSDDASLPVVRSLCLAV
ncbi:hypothetical protein PIB30_051856 [Stylosanthes scabra]|uniref:Uncharacterized protein n=1 Tax=Stylosanthes scabra TaxID=79078 RepID=A0ABU6RI67_9FABA|nr:hypothetical protein [Stylosanthes scabra]